MAKVTENSSFRFTLMVQEVAQVKPVEMRTSPPLGSDWICTWLVVPRVVVAQGASDTAAPIASAGLILVFGKVP